MNNRAISIFALFSLVICSVHVYAQAAAEPKIVPEFTTIGAGIAILGSAIYAFYRKRHSKA